MAEVLSLKQSKYVRANTLANLEDYVGRTFIICKNGATTAHKLLEVKNNKVYLAHMGDREDKFSMPLNKFLKYYELPTKG